MNILVTGGAGYVGSVVAEELVRTGHRVVVLDNLQQGHEEAIAEGATFVLGDICQPETLERLFCDHAFDAVMHMAAETVVEDSVTDPGRFFRTNVIGGINLLEAMIKHKVQRIIFSSTAAVYGEPLRVPIDQDHPKKPVNVYGTSKLMFEDILECYGQAHGLKHISLRYFNAAGATERLGENHHPETHLIPNVLKAALTGAPVPIFGTDYPTPDGTCIRDYVHVLDIARAHILALEKLDSLSGRAYNLGNGRGYSVIEVIQSVGRITGRNVITRIRPRRVGDPAALVASSSRARFQLAWSPRFHELELIIESTWKWMQGHPEGYSRLAANVTDSTANK